MHIDTGAKRIADSHAFHMLMLFVIIASSVMVGLETYSDLVKAHELFFDLFNIIVPWVFALEIAVRIASHGNRPFEFFREGWNIFDFIIVAVLLLHLHAEYLAVLRLVRVLRILEIARTMRVLRLIDCLQLQFFVNAFLKGMTSLGSIAVLLSLHIYIYAVIGVFAFGSIVPAHFGTLHNAVTTLLYVITLDKLNLLQILTTPNALGESISVFAASVYSISFVLIGIKIVMNLVIGAIVKSMHDPKEEQETLAALRRKHHLVTIEERISLIEADLQESAACLRLLRKAVQEQQLNVRSARGQSTKKTKGKKAALAR
jgi:voltage-gated sodium channel